MGANITPHFTENTILQTPIYKKNQSNRQKTKNIVRQKNVLFYKIITYSESTRLHDLEIIRNAKMRLRMWRLCIL